MEAGAASVVVCTPTIGVWLVNGCAGPGGPGIAVDVVARVESVFRLDTGIESRSSEALVCIHVDSQRDLKRCAHHFDANVRPRAEQSLTAFRRAAMTSASTEVDSLIQQFCKIWR